MAKNKKKGKASNNNANSSTEIVDPVKTAPDASSTAPIETPAPETVQETEDAPAPETPQQSDQNTLEQSEAASDALNNTESTGIIADPIDDMPLDSLKAEVSVLRQLLEAKDKEIADLKAQVNKPLKGTVSAMSPVTDMAQLQERLAKLRKEQAEADAARDAAWGQLKNVVTEISKLANPDYVASLVKQQTAAPSDNGTTPA